MFLAISDLCVNYGKLEVLKGVSLEIDQGEIALILGANGSGKSTLFKVISGLHRAISGSIWFQGKEIGNISATQILKTGIAQVPEGKRLFIDMTVSENLEMGGCLNRHKGSLTKDIRAICERFPVLDRKRNMKSGKLSGGEQQMLAIGRALMAKPKLLLMDEPSQGLSPVSINEVVDIVTGLNQDGTTILLIEHNLQLGLSIAHKIYVLENGKIVFEAKSTDLSAVEYAEKIYLAG